MSDLGFERLPPTVLQPTPHADTGTTTSGALEGAADKPTVQSRWFGTLLGGSQKVNGYTVHLFADPAGWNITCGADITPPTAGNTVVVGFFDDNSVAIIGVSS